MPFVLHYSVQSNTASGIRVSRRVIYRYIYDTVCNMFLQSAMFLFGNAERGIVNKSVD